MKLTKELLKTLIKEETKKLLEWPDWGGEDPHADGLEVELEPVALETVNLSGLSGEEGYQHARDEIKDELTFILDTWEKGRYDSDEERWQAYAHDIVRLAESLGDVGHEGACEQVHPGIEHQVWEDHRGE